jgi:hypothetical protein
VWRGCALRSFNGCSVGEKREIRGVRQPRMGEAYRLGSLNAYAATRTVGGGACVGHSGCGWGGVVLHGFAVSSYLCSGRKLSVGEVVTVHVTVHVGRSDGCRCVCMWWVGWGLCCGLACECSNLCCQRSNFLSLCGLPRSRFLPVPRVEVSF